MSQTTFLKENLEPSCATQDDIFHVKHVLRCSVSVPLSTKSHEAFKNLNHQQFIHFLLKDAIASKSFPLPNPFSEGTAVGVLRIHRRLGLDEPLEHYRLALESCEVQRRFASGAAARGPSPQAEPNGTEGAKNFEKILAPQKWKF